MKFITDSGMNKMEERFRTPSYDRSHVNISSGSPFRRVDIECVVWLTRREATRYIFREFAQIIAEYPRDTIKDFISYCSLRGTPSEKKKKWWKRQIRDGRATFVKIGRKVVEWRQGASLRDRERERAHREDNGASVFSDRSRAHDRR